MPCGLWKLYLYHILLQFEKILSGFLSFYMKFNMFEIEVQFYLSLFSFNVSFSWLNLKLHLFRNQLRENWDDSKESNRNTKIDKKNSVNVEQQNVRMTFYFIFVFLWMENKTKIQFIAFNIHFHKNDYFFFGTYIDVRI